MQYIVPSVATGLISSAIFAMVRPANIAASMNQRQWPFIAQKPHINKHCAQLSQILSDIDRIGAERLWCAIEALLQFADTQTNSPMKQAQCAKLLHECKRCLSRGHTSIREDCEVDTVVMAEMYLQDLETQLALVLENFVRGV